MTPEELLNQISDGIWINKGGLKVPDDVVQALQQKEDWFDGLNPVVYSKDNLPDIKGILNFFSEQELDQEVGFAAQGGDRRSLIKGKEEELLKEIVTEHIYIYIYAGNSSSNKGENRNRGKCIQFIPNSQTLRFKT
jgi:hypothetical protein